MNLSNIAAIVALMLGYGTADSRIGPFSPTAHRRLPSLVPKIELRDTAVPLLRGLFDNSSDVSKTLTKRVLL
jgi:hypothetical protein